MLTVGLTGGIACGKSTVADMFVRRGAYLVDFDVLAHEVQKPGRAAWEKVVAYFGKDILREDRTIDRVRLGSIVFADPVKLAVLNDIVHPYVFLEWHDHLEKIYRKDKNAIIFAAVPLLFEIKRQNLFDVIVLVVVSREEQLKRLMARTGLSAEEAEKRIASQMPVEEKTALADILIENQNSIIETEKRAEEVWQQLLALKEKKALKRKME